MLARGYSVLCFLFCFFNYMCVFVLKTLKKKKLEATERKVRVLLEFREHLLRTLLPWQSLLCVWPSRQRRDECAQQGTAGHRRTWARVHWASWTEGVWEEIMVRSCHLHSIWQGVAVASGHRTVDKLTGTQSVHMTSWCRGIFPMPLDSCFHFLKFEKCQQRIFILIKVRSRCN